MGETQALWEHRLLTRLTTIKLAVGILDRRASLSEPDRDLLRLALEASDRLADDIVSTAPAEGGRPRQQPRPTHRPGRLDQWAGTSGRS